jgi:hypothetical protein
MKKTGRATLPFNVIQRLRKATAWRHQIGAQFVRYAVRKEICIAERRMERERGGWNPQ